MVRNKKMVTATAIVVVAVIIAAICVGVVLGTTKKEVTPNARKFEVDHEANTFLMDGKPFRYVSGSFHYFRALPDVWQDRLKTMRASGLNAIDTYIEWALHNPHDGVYYWDGIADVEKFLELATEEGFYIILRPGPYICAERDNGGVPHWLFTKYPKIALRTSDENYKKEVALWYSKLMPRLEKYLYGNGGRIIMVQVENEYGAFPACDKAYTKWLAEETEKYVKGQALLFTTDIPQDNFSCGHVEGVFATTDFGLEKIQNIDEVWKILRKYQPTGPLVNSEFYPGWLTHWQEPNQRRNAQEVANALRKILEYGASVNIYMFFGGTNFGFTAGANDMGYGLYNADITSYDYDAVMDEAGNKTLKYKLVSEVIHDFLSDIPEIPNSDLASKAVSYGSIQMKPVARLLSGIGRENLAKGESQTKEKPLSFEELDQYSGLLLFETSLPEIKIDPTLLTVNGLKDRAHVYVDEKFVGTLSRENIIYSLPINKGFGKRLQILVENQGRINFNIANDTKGIFGNVTIQQQLGKLENLSSWTTTAFPLESIDSESLLSKIKDSPENIDASAEVLTEGPVIFHGEFTASEIGDSYLNTQGWGKGIAYLNNFNLGRYWPLVGPQGTLYVPRSLVKEGVNNLIFIEYQRSNWNASLGANMVHFDLESSLDN